MNNKPIDKSKKSNVKCEHCKYWGKWNYDGNACKNPDSEHHGANRFYYNRCKHFEWLESEVRNADSN